MYVYEKNENENESEDDKKVKFRTGINVGDVFKYTDIKEGINFAGDAINKVARLTDLGKEWHILSTDDFYKHTKDLNTSYLEDFHCVDNDYEVKHREKLKVYNVYNKERNTGNPTDP